MFIPKQIVTKFYLRKKYDLNQNFRHIFGGGKHPRVFFCESTKINMFVQILNLTTTMCALSSMTIVDTGISTPIHNVMYTVNNF